jgi:hypothetical protein
VEVAKEVALAGVSGSGWKVEWNGEGADAAAKDDAMDACASTCPSAEYTDDTETTSPVSFSKPSTSRDELAVRAVEVVVRADEANDPAGLRSVSKDAAVKEPLEVYAGREMSTPAEPDLAKEGGAGLV